MGVQGLRREGHIPLWHLKTDKACAMAWNHAWEITQVWSRSWNPSSPNYIINSPVGKRSNTVRVDRENGVERTTCGVCSLILLCGPMTTRVIRLGSKCLCGLSHLLFCFVLFDTGSHKCQAGLKLTVWLIITLNPWPAASTSELKLQVCTALCFLSCCTRVCIQHWLCRMWI